MGKLSVCMIVQNEAENIGSALASARLVADEIIVVDTGSTDNTVATAELFDVEVFKTNWRNSFSLARNESIKHATGDWILWLDADDRLSTQAAQKIIELKATNPDRVFGFTLRNINHTDQPFIGGTEITQTRMFPRRGDIRFELRLHEQVTASAIRAGLWLEHHPEIVIEHHGYQDCKVVDKKLKRNICLMLMDMGFPDDAQFTIFDLAGFHCFYSPSVLSIWEHNIPIGFCDPFELELPDNLQKQNETMLTRAMQIIEQYREVCESPFGQGVQFVGPNAYSPYGTIEDMRAEIARINNGLNMARTEEGCVA